MVDLHCLKSQIKNVEYNFESVTVLSKKVVKYNAGTSRWYQQHTFEEWLSFCDIYNLKTNLNTFIKIVSFFRCTCEELS